MMALERKIAALENRRWPEIVFECLSWIWARVPSLLLFLLTFGGLIVHAAMSFIVFFWGQTRDYSTHIWHRALAAARSISFGLLVLNLASSGAIWWGARVFLACFLLAQSFELGRQALALPVLLGLIPALGFRDLAMAGWPVDLLPLMWGGYMSVLL